MTVRVSHEVISAAVTLIEGTYKKSVHRSFLEPFLAGILVSLISFYCGLLYGTVGFLYGVTITAVFAYYLTRDCFIPIDEIIQKDLDPEAREELHLTILRTVRDLQAPDIARFDYTVLLSLLLNAVSLQQGVLHAVEKFLVREQKLTRHEVATRKKC